MDRDYMIALIDECEAAIAAEGHMTNAEFDDMGGLNRLRRIARRMHDRKAHHAFLRAAWLADNGEYHTSQCAFIMLANWGYRNV